MQAPPTRRSCTAACAESIPAAWLRGTRSFLPKPASWTSILLNCSARPSRVARPDLHLCVGSPPMVRIHGNLSPIRKDVLDAESCRDLIYGIFTENQRAPLRGNVGARFRRGGAGPGPFPRQRPLQPRRGRGDVPPHPERDSAAGRTGLPPIVRELCKLEQEWSSSPASPARARRRRSPPWSRKSTAAGPASSSRSRTDRVHLRAQLCRVKQREIGTDTKSFPIALRHVLRQDPTSS